MKICYFLMFEFDSIKRILKGRTVPYQIYHQYTSIGQVIMTECRRYRRKVLQVNDDDGIELTGFQMIEFMQKIAKNLYSFGIRSGDVASLSVSNTTYVAPLLFGCLLLKVIVNPVEKFFDVHEIVDIIQNTRPKMVFCDHDNVDRISEALQIIESDSIILTLTERVGNHLHISDLLLDSNVDIDE